MYELGAVEVLLVAEYQGGGGTELGTGTELGAAADVGAVAGWP